MTYVLIIYIILAVLMLVVHYFVSKEFYKAAAMKGWARKKYFYMAFFLGVVGYLLIIALPDRGGRAMTAVVSDDLPEL